MRLLLRLVLLGGAIALGTWAFGWLAVPVIAAVWGGWVRDTPRPGLVPATAAGLGWGILLIWTGAVGPLPALVAKLGGITGLPGISWIVATLFFPVALAWSAAVLAGAVVSAVRR
ncbi:MAG: hypothetical protein EXR93_12180 [Gemmatimonadetes bacterium]|nr:hypothetical protein [Gemmatimonadota bacterium]